jgi:nucleotide-binding universal stress UspA family protein
MYKRMLILLDGSNLAEVVFSYARELSGRLGLDLDFLHVCKPDEAEHLPMHEAYIHLAAERLKAQLRRTANKSGTAGGSVKVKGAIVVGYPAEEILKYAEEESIDFIMLATHGASKIGRWGIGAVADKVIHATSVPVWLVPSHLHDLIVQDTLPSRSILVPLDGSKLAETVVPHVKELIKQRGVEFDILLVSVIKNVMPPVENREIVRLFSGEDPSNLNTTGEIYLKGMVRQLQKEGFKARFEQLVGDPADEIVRYAAKTQPRLIAMSTHGRSGFNRFVFGSVTENVLRRLERTPLFLVRPGTDTPAGESEQRLTAVETEGEDRD